MGYPSFNVGDVLTAADMNAVGLWRLTGCTVTSTGGTTATASNGVITLGTGNTSVTVNNAFTSDYHSYKIMMIGGTGSIASNIRLTLGASAASYYSAGAVFTYTGAAQTSIFDNNAASWTRAGQMSTDALFMDVTLNNPQVAKFTNVSWVYALPAAGFNGGQAAGFHGVATAYTSFTITPDVGTMTGGTIRVYGYRN